MEKNMVYIDCFFYVFYIEKNKLIKYINQYNQKYIKQLILK